MNIRDWFKRRGLFYMSSIQNQTEIWHLVLSNTILDVDYAHSYTYTLYIYV